MPHKGKRFNWVESNVTLKLAHSFVKTPAVTLSQSDVIHLVAVGFLWQQDYVIVHSELKYREMCVILGNCDPSFGMIHLIANAHSYSVLLARHFRNMF